MPKTGGMRPGAGRPKGSKNPVDREIVKEAKRQNMTPLAYMLSVMSDVDVDPNRRDRMAMCAAPYCHPKADYIGKRQHDEDLSQTVDRGTAWEALLRRDGRVDDRKN